jgi:hypothetical protein
VVLVSPRPDEPIDICTYRRALETATQSALPLTKAERRQAVRWLLAQQPEMSHRDIARTVGVAHSTVDRWIVGRGASEENGDTDSSGPRPEDIADKLVRFWQRLDDSRRLFDLFGPKRMGRHLADAFTNRFGDNALREARLVAGWTQRAVETLSNPAQK